jgi:hypothetical protein
LPDLLKTRARRFNGPGAKNNMVEREQNAVNPLREVKQLTVYPNPARGTVTFLWQKADNQAGRVLKVFNGLGKFETYPSVKTIKL